MNTRFSFSDMTKEELSEMKRLIKERIDMKSLRKLWDEKKINLMVYIHTHDHLVINS